MFKNKTIKLFLILGVILFSLIGVVGCSDCSKNEEQILSEIKQDYYNEFVSEIQNKNVSDIIINYYIGEYNGYFVLMLSYVGEPFFDMIKTIYFDDCLITYPNSNILRAWKEGAFYDLKELYALGELSKNDIEEIIEQYNILYKNGNKN
jgi:hypothetical protein